MLSLFMAEQSVNRGSIPQLSFNATALTSLTSKATGCKGFGHAQGQVPVHDRQ